MSKKSKKSTSHSSEIFVGMPIFGCDPASPFRAPIGQAELCKAIKQETKDWKKILEKLFKEYMSILLALKEMDIAFKIVFTNSKKILPGLREKIEEWDFEFLEFPRLDLRVLTFPRDLAIKLSDGTLLINSDLKRPKKKSKKAVSKLIMSPYGEGGRILYRRNVALVSQRYYPELRAGLEGVKPPLELLVRAGLRVGLIPNAVHALVYQGIPCYEPDDHLDRTSNLLEDEKGGLHFIVEPEIRSNLKDLCSGSPDTPQQTFSQIRKVCNEMGIILHVLKKLKVPALTCLIQFRNGKTLMSSGDGENAQIIADIVGEKNLYFTSEPIQYFPVMSKAGIRCLIGEFPSLVANLWK